jgi:hypothetical protein
MLRLNYDRTYDELLETRRRVAATRQKVIEAERELEARPTRVLVRTENLDKIVVDNAHKDRDDAYKRRDTAMGALSDVRLLHHRDDDERHCCCGLLYDKCEVAQIVDRWDGVWAWEQQQVRQSERGERHHLQHDHPALNDKTWLTTHYVEPA